MKIFGFYVGRDDKLGRYLESMIRVESRLIFNSGQIDKLHDSVIMLEKRLSVEGHHIVGLRDNLRELTNRVIKPEQKERRFNTVEVEVFANTKHIEGLYSMQARLEDIFGKLTDRVIMLEEK